MIRWVLIVGLAVAACATGCGSTSTYISYEVVRTPERLKPGDEVQVLPNNGETIRGKLVQVGDARLTIATELSGERTIAWEEIRVLERVQKIRAR